MPSTTSHDEWLSPADLVTERLIPSVGTFYTWRKKGIGPRAYRIGKHLKIRRSDLEAWLAQRVIQP